MYQEQVKLIKTDLNKVFDIINKTKILGREQLTSKFEKYNRHIKNGIEIPKLKNYQDTIDYETKQLLYSDITRWESTNRDACFLDLYVYIDFISDDYKATFRVYSEDERYSPAFAMNPTGKDLYIRSITTCGILDFLEELMKVYSDLCDLEYMRTQLIDASYVDDLNAIIRSIINKLES